MPEILTGKFQERVRKADSGWATGTLRLPSGVDVVVTLVHPFSLDTLIIHGEGVWGTYRGEPQFKFTSASPVEGDKALIVQTLQELDGIGPTKARVIVTAWGVDFADHMNEKELAKLPGIKGKTAKTIVHSWEEKHHQFGMLMMAKKWGLSFAQARRVIQQFGDGYEKVVLHDPYRLIEVRGINFKTADRVAMQLGAPKHSKYRYAAALTSVLEEHQGSGHTMMTKEEATRKLQSLIPDLVPALLETTDGPKFMRLSGHFMLTANYDDEQTIAKFVRDRISSPPRLLPGVSAPPVFEQLTDEQNAAIAMMLTHRFSLVTGQPGCGKTTVLQHAVPWMLRQGLSVTLMAPTGRAAVRMREATGHEASTIHMVLQHTSFLSSNIVIVDESSMIPNSLMVRLFDLLMEGTHLVLIGDGYQLPPVEPGQPFRDLLNIPTVPRTRLTKIMRQEQDAGIIANAANLLKKKPLQLEGWPDFTWKYIATGEDDSAAVNEVLNGFKQRRWPMDAIVLAAFRTQVKALNDGLQGLFNANKPRIKFGDKYFSVGDPVRQTRNNYQLEVMNGMIGHIEWLREPDLDEWAGTVAHIRFEDKLVHYTEDDMDEVVLGYAVTIHASQGGEWDNVVMIMPWRPGSFMADFCRAEIPYTGMTRAKKKLWLLGDSRSLRHYLNAKTLSGRSTLLRSLFA